MADDFIIDALARLTIFKGLAPAQLREIAARAQRAIYHPGSVIIEENALGDAAILILTGEAVRVSGPEMQARMEPVRPGSLVGEASMLIETEHGSTVVARTEVRALQISRDDLHAQILEDPSIADALTHNIALRLIRMADELRKVDAALTAPQDPVWVVSALRKPQAASPPLPAPVH